MTGRMQYIRDRYQVPAKRGGGLWFDGYHCQILSAPDGHLAVRREDGRRMILHPTWNIRYDEAAEG